MTRVPAPETTAERVYVRYGHDTRLHCVLIEPDMLSLRPDLVLVRAEDSIVHPARIVGMCHETSGASSSAGEVIAGYNVDSEGDHRVSDVVDTREIPHAHCSGHRWGALGLPQGSNTHLSPLSESLPPDDVYATSSRGYHEAAANRIHMLVPGDVLSYRQKEVTITAINRRNNIIELRHSDDQATFEIPLNDFLDEEQR